MSAVHPSTQVIRDALRVIEESTSLLDKQTDVKEALETIRSALPKDATRPEWLRKSPFTTSMSLHIDDSAGDPISIYHTPNQDFGFFRLEAGHPDDSNIIDFDRDTADRLKVIHEAIGAWLESDEAYIAYVSAL